jgi:hypothetical protein
MLALVGIFVQLGAPWCPLRPRKPSVDNLKHRPFDMFYEEYNRVSRRLRAEEITAIHGFPSESSADHSFVGTYSFSGHPYGQAEDALMGFQDGGLRTWSIDRRDAHSQRNFVLVPIRSSSAPILRIPTPLTF